MESGFPSRQRWTSEASSPDTEVPSGKFYPARTDGVSSEYSIAPGEDFARLANSFAFASLLYACWNVESARVGSRLTAWPRQRTEPTERMSLLVARDQKR